jgi:3-methyl-2-oxobutanoate hydroxymethyltransferase
LQTVQRLSEEAIPVIGHVGLVPSKRTWTGGFKAVGKSAESAMQVFNAVKAYESAGAFGAEIEVVPSEVATEISKRTTLFMVSMGAGTGCDAQYLFAEDVLGSNTGHYPRHAKRYRDFAAENARLQKERVAAFTEFAGDVKTGAYPEAGHEVGITPEEMKSFRKLLSSSKS